MKPRIAIPVPTSTDLAYNQRSWPQYASAVERSGGEPVEIPLLATPTAIANLINTCQAVLLPGSPADVNPHKYGQEPIPECAPADSPRENVDELLLQDAHNLYKPIFAICFGIQFLNVWRGGTLVQDLTILPVNHAAGSSVAIAHTAAVAPDSLLGTLLTPARPQSRTLSSVFPSTPATIRRSASPATASASPPAAHRTPLSRLSRAARPPKAPPHTSSSASSGIRSAATT